MSQSGRVGVSVAQFAPTDDRERNRRAARELVLRAAGEGADLVVLPEYSSYFTPMMDAGFGEAAESLDGPFTSELSAAAAETGATVVAGLVEKGAGERWHNAAVALDPRRGLVAVYRKQHLYDAFGQRESDWVEPGGLDEPQTFRVGALTVGMQTCYDLRFPESTRRLVDAGADLVVVPSEWVRGPLKERHWSTLIAARAIENTVFVAAADHPAPIGVGGSTVVDPAGVPLVTLGEGEGLATAQLDPARIRAVREVNPALELRRYGVVPR